MPAASARATAGPGSSKASWLRTLASSRSPMVGSTAPTKATAAGPISTNSAPGKGISPRVSRRLAASSPTRAARASPSSLSMPPSSSACPGASKLSPVSAYAIQLAGRSRLKGWPSTYDRPSTAPPALT